MIIMCDLDAVLNDLIPKTLAVYNYRSNKNIQMQNITTYHINECLPKDDADKIYELWQDKALWDSLEPVTDSQWGIETLINMGHKVVIATATYYEQFAWKLEWIKKYFPMIDTNDVIRINDKSLLRCDVLIEDNLQQLIKSYCERICLDYPYNHDEVKDEVYDIYRASNWRDVVKYINDIERKMKEWEKM